MNKIAFRGAGCNGPSLRTAIHRAIYSPSKDTVPAGATWPFVTLSIDEQSVKFSMARIQRSVIPSDVRKISLSKTGYLFFRTRNSVDFGFATIKIRSLLQELQKRGYHLDDSCRRNVLVAQISLALLVAIPVAFLAVIVIMTVLKPNGI